MNAEEAALIKQFGAEFRKKIEKHDLEQLQREAFVPPCVMYPRD